MRYLGLWAAALVLSAGAAVADICVVNGTDAPYIFTVEVHSGARRKATLAPGSALCLPEAPGSPGGVVAAFDGPERVEGCSRQVAPGGTETLLLHANFDRCLWAPQGR
jgi:hypothetical protein